MSPAKTKTTREKTGLETNGANLGFEAKLWEAADKLRNNVDPACLLYTSDAADE